VTQNLNIGQVYGNKLTSNTYNSCDMLIRSVAWWNIMHRL